ncbi:MAG TPA: ATP-binding cassette domain-containing protein, partial [Reyranella sp.]|nr:ATP-binding cassette domain-containing protein [Reyranella sp.]
MDHSYLKFEQIGMSFRRGQMATEVLRDVNLTIEQGEFVSLIGHSGCGKSTVLSMIAGLQRATKGGVVINGRQTIEPGANRA